MNEVTAADLEASELRCVNCEWRPVNAIGWRRLGSPPCPKCGCTTLSPCAPVKRARTSWEILNDEVENMANALLANDDSV